MLKVIDYLANAQTNGANIDVETQKEMIFETFFEDFVRFRIVYNLSKKSLMITELMKEFHEFETMINARKSSKEANLAEKSPFSSKDKKKKKNKKATKKPSIPPKAKENKKSEIDMMIKALRKDREIGKNDVIREFLIPIALCVLYFATTILIQSSSTTHIVSQRTGY